MARSLAELKETRAARQAEMRTIHDAAANENRDLSDEENTRFQALTAQDNALGNEITRVEKLAEMDRRAEASPIDGEYGRETRAFSVAKAIQDSMNGRLTGREAEVHAELARGRESRGVMVPTSALLEHRVVNTGTSPGGGYLVGTQMMPVTDHPRPVLLIEGLGATVMRDLTGDVELPRLSQSGFASWINEHASATRSDPSFSKALMTPSTVAAEYEISRRMILQSSTAIEALLRRDLGLLLRQALDGAAIRGSGTLQPTGILNTPGIHAVPAASAELVDVTSDMIASLEIDDITGTRSFLTNPKVANVVRKKKDADGHVIGLAEIFHGEKVSVTNQVPSNIGTGSNKSALIYGQWSELVIGYWSGVDILANPYHSDVASKGGVLIHAFLDADVLVREPKAFAVAEIG